MPDEDPPRVLAGRYALVQKIGQGGMGAVWRAWDTEMDRTVAVKEILAEAAGAIAVGRFRREARLTARLRHPGVVALHDVCTCDDATFLVMEFVAGRTFADLLRESRPGKVAGGPHAPERLRAEIALLTQAAEAVDHAHREGVVHRDLKPANILVDAEGHARVTDFGIARETAVEGEASVRLTLPGRALGTPTYMSPEQLNAASEAGPESDVWSLGAMLYEVLTGRPPFVGESTLAILTALVSHDLVPPRERCRGVPDALDRICCQALDRDVTRRYGSAGAMAEDLRLWLTGDEVASGHRSRWALRLRRRTPWLIGALGLLAVAAFAGLALHARAREVERVRETMSRIAASVREFEDRIARDEMPPEVQAEAARQPLGVIETLVAADAEFGPAYTLRGWVHQLTGNLRSAEADLDRGCELSPEQAVTWFLRGVYHLEQYALLRRGAIFGGIGAPGEVVAESDAARSHLEKGLADLQRVEQANRIAPQLTERDLDQGRALAAVHAGGQAGCEEALRLLTGPADARTHLVRGLALHQLGRSDEAVAECRLAVEAWPRHPLMRLVCAEVLLARGRELHRRAVDEQARGSDPGDLFARTEADYLAAVALEPRAWFPLASLRRDQGRFAEAVEAAEAFQRLAPASAAMAEKLLVETRARIAGRTGK